MALVDIPSLVEVQFEGTTLYKNEVRTRKILGATLHELLFALAPGYGNILENSKGLIIVCVWCEDDGSFRVNLSGHSRTRDLGVKWRDFKSDSLEKVEAKILLWFAKNKAQILSATE